MNIPLLWALTAIHISIPERAGRRFPFVWYLEDDVYLPGSWSAFMRRYDVGNQSDVDLLVVQAPYFVDDSLSP